jgi:hypothetical protein
MFNGNQVTKINLIANQSMKSTLKFFKITALAIYGSTYPKKSPRETHLGFLREDLYGQASSSSCCSSSS